MCSQLFNFKPDASLTYKLVHNMMIANDKVIYNFCGLNSNIV